MAADRKTIVLNRLFGVKSCFYGTNGVFSCSFFVYPFLRIDKGVKLLHVLHSLNISLMFELINRKSSRPEAAIPVRDRKMV